MRTKATIPKKKWKKRTPTSVFTFRNEQYYKDETNQKAKFHFHFVCFVMSSFYRLALCCYYVCVWTKYVSLLLLLLYSFIRVHNIEKNRSINKKRPLITMQVAVWLLLRWRLLTHIFYLLFDGTTKRKGQQWRVKIYNVRENGLNCDVLYSDRLCFSQIIKNGGVNPICIWKTKTPPTHFTIALQFRCIYYSVAHNNTKVSQASNQINNHTCIRIITQPDLRSATAAACKKKRRRENWVESWKFRFCWHCELFIDYYHKELIPHQLPSPSPLPQQQ